jgi:putative transcriptional regulator
MGKKYYSEALEAVHQSAQDLYEIGAISEKEMKEFDEGCFVKEPDEKYKTEKSCEIEHATA